MLKKVDYKLIGPYAAFVTGIFTQVDTAHANNFSDVAKNINTSIEELPGLITSVSYLLGILLGIVGVLKLKDHVENPSQTAMKDGAIRLAAGGALFALPIVYESMQNTIGTTGFFVEPSKIHKTEFNTF
jgi:hypothetical protein